MHNYLNFLYLHIKLLRSSTARSKFRVYLVIGIVMVSSQLFFSISPAIIFSIVYANDTNRKSSNFSSHCEKLSCSKNFHSLRSFAFISRCSQFSFFGNELLRENEREKRPRKLHQFYFDRSRV